MRNLKGRAVLGAFLFLGAFAALAVAQTPKTPAVAEKSGSASGQAVKAAPSAFELKMRILEGSREKSTALVRPVTSSFLEFQTFANFEDEENVATEQQIKKVFSVNDLGLLTEAALVWEKGKNEKAFHSFRINGQQYQVTITPGRLPERNQFHIEVTEQSAAKKTSLLDTEFSLPDKTAAVFGFEDTKLKSYFITLSVARWLGEPAGQATGGVVGGVLKAGGGAQKVMPPKLIKEVKPLYPEAARKAGVGGYVIMEATTDKYGRVADVKVLRSIPLLDQAAIDAVKQWVYEPMVVDGQPRPMVFTVTVRFALDKDKKPSVGGVAGGVKGGVTGGVSTGVGGAVAGGVAGGVEGGVKGDVRGGVVGGVLGGAAARDLEQFEGDAVRAVGEIKPPKPIKQVDPVYPEEARKAGVEGLVILEAKADEQGNVVDSRILRSIPALDKAALDAVKQWKYEPLVIDGKPHKAVFTVTVRFALSDGDRAKALKKFAEGAVAVEGDIKPPKQVKEVMPAYPGAARSAGVQGVVILSVRTDEYGRVQDTMVLRSIPLLDQAAIDAVMQWVYEPLVVDGKAVPAVFNVTVRFRLE